MDLVYLYKMPNVSIQKIIKTVLKNYVHDRIDTNLTHDRVSIPRVIHNKPLPSSAQIHIYIDENEDKEIVEWISKIPEGFRNAMIKNILRGYIDFPMTIPYETNVEVLPTSKAKENKHSISNLNKSLKNVSEKKSEKKQEKNTINKENKEENKSVADVVLEQELNPSSENKVVHTTEADPILADSHNKELNRNNNSENIPEKAGQKKEDDTENNNMFDDFESMMESF